MRQRWMDPVQAVLALAIGVGAVGACYLLWTSPKDLQWPHWRYFVVTPAIAIVLVGMPIWWLTVSKSQRPGV